MLECNVTHGLEPSEKRAPKRDFERDTACGVEHDAPRPAPSTAERDFERDFAVYESRIGCDLRVSTQFNEAATPLAIDRFCDGIGEGNPLFRDGAHESPWGERMAPPSFIFSVFPGWILQGLPGWHAFHTSSDITFHQPIFEGQAIVPRSVFTGYKHFPNKMDAGSLCEYQQASWLDEQGQPLATAKLSGVRVLREKARQASINEERVLPHPWKPAELEILEERILRHEPQGTRPLFVEDVQVGDSLPTLVKGPLGMTDIVAYCVGASPVRLQAHELALQHYAQHPAWRFRDADGRTVEPMFGVHYNQSAATHAGMPAPFDIGTQRHCWLVQMLTDWMGDAGFLARCEARYTGFVFLSDVVFLSGSVTGVGIEGNVGTVSVRTVATNQCGQEVMRGRSTVLLPTRGHAPAVAARFHDRQA